MKLLERLLIEFFSKQRFKVHIDNNIEYCYMYVDKETLSRKEILRNERGIFLIVSLNQRNSSGQTLKRTKELLKL